MIQSVIQKLINDAAVQTALGQVKAGDRYKVFPVVADEDEELPFAVGSITGNTPRYCKDGASILDTVDFRIVSYAKEYVKTDEIDNAIRFALDAQSWTLASIPVSAWLVNTQDLWDQGKQCFARVSDYKAHVTRTI